MLIVHSVTVVDLGLLTRVIVTEEFVTVLKVGAVCNRGARIIDHAHNKPLIVNGGEGCRQPLIRFE